MRGEPKLPRVSVERAKNLFLGTTSFVDRIALYVNKMGIIGYSLIILIITSLLFIASLVMRVLWGMPSYLMEICLLINLIQIIMSCYFMFRFRFFYAFAVLVPVLVFMVDILGGKEIVNKITDYRVALMSNEFATCSNTNKFVQGKIHIRICSIFYYPDAGIDDAIVYDSSGLMNSPKYRTSEWWNAVRSVNNVAPFCNTSFKARHIAGNFYEVIFDQSYPTRYCADTP